MEIKNKDLKRRIIEISYKHKLSHLGSCLTAVDIIKEIYDQKAPDEPFILSSGHAGLALYTVLESRGGRDANDVFDHHGVHPDRCDKCLLDCSTGSLGQGLPIAVGMALADRNKRVWCLISDGEYAEGSIHEALRVIEEQKLFNIRIRANVNGWAAYREADWIKIHNDLTQVDMYLQFQEQAQGHEAWDDNQHFVVAQSTNSDYLPFLRGQAGHYVTMTEANYKQAMEILK